MLYKCSTTEAGILPNVCVYNKAIPDRTKAKVDTKKEYYAQYQNTNELNETMRDLNVYDPVARYYNLKKFKYLAPKLNEDGTVKKVTDKDKHNKMSYC
jgi:hypothetical protein